MGAWKSMEDTWATALQQGKTVKVEIKPIYQGSNLRPMGFEVDEWIDGVKVTPKKTFAN